MIEVHIQRAARKKGCENPKQLADRMDCAPTIIWKIWTGKCEPKLPMLDRICDALNCELSELITRKPNRRRSNGNARTPKGAGRRKG